MLLEEYASDSSTEDEPSRAAVHAVRPGIPRALATSSSKRRALPSLPQDFLSGPADDPSLHQGRKRTRPFVEGEYSTHIFLQIAPSATLRAVITRLIRRTQTLLPPGFILNAIISAPPRGEPPDTPLPIDHDLHISLTHPLPLLRTQINHFRPQIQHRLKASPAAAAFRLSFVGDVKCYYNGRQYGGEGDGGRAFLALRVGSGAPLIRKMVQEAIDPLLQSLHLPTYHSSPEFHASFAWALLPGDEPMAAKHHGSQGIKRAQMSDTARFQEQGDDASSTAIPRSSPFSPQLLEQINQEFRDDLLKAQPQGGWVITGVTLKIGGRTFCVSFDGTGSRVEGSGALRGK